MVNDEIRFSEADKYCKKLNQLNHPNVIKLLNVLPKK